MTVYLISVRLSFLTIFLFFFFILCFILLPFIFLYTSLRLIREERAKATSRKEIEDCADKSKTMKISSFQLRRSSQVKLWLIRLYRIMVCDFGYLFILDYEANSFYILLTLFYFMKTLFWEIQFFLALLSAYHSCLWYVFD